MKVSVIIPVKNRAQLLRVTLDNILSQEARPHEIIVVDDASTDEIQKVIDDYRQDVLFTANAGKGPGAARNTGLRLATGNAVQFFDSDDLMTRNKLKVQAGILAQRDVALVYGPSVKATNIGGKWLQNDVIMQYYPLPNRPMANLVLEGWCAITQTTLFRKDLIDEVGFWREDLMPHEDYEYWFRIAKIAKVIRHENESCVIYRQHQNQITDLAVPNQARWLDGLNAMKLIKQGIDYKPAVQSAILFKGRYANSKSEYIKQFGNDGSINLDLLDKLAIPFFKLKTKLGNSATGSGWQKIHGILKHGEKEFDRYIALLS